MIRIKVLLILAAIAASAGFGSGFWAKTVLAHAAEKKEQQKALEAFGKYAEETVGKLNRDWTRVSTETTRVLSEAADQRDRDAQLEKKALGAIREVQDELKGISEQIRLVENVGACRLDLEFIRLRNEAVDAANARRASARDPDTP